MLREQEVDDAESQVPNESGLGPVHGRHYCSPVPGALIVADLPKGRVNHEPITTAFEASVETSSSLYSSLNTLITVAHGKSLDSWAMVNQQ